MASSATSWRRQRLRVGDTVESGKRADIKPGNALPLANIPVGTIVHNVELKAGKGGQIARAGGTYVQLVGRDQGYAQLKLGSGEMRTVRGECMATIGAVSNPDQQNINLGKAGRKRWMGKRPSTRGVAMNPVDHPHGGGEGPHLGRPPSGYAVGQTDQGRADAGRRASPRTSSSSAAVTSARNVREHLRWHAQSGKARSSTAICSGKPKGRANPAATR